MKIANKGVLLLVDDELELLRLYSVILAPLDCEIVTAQNGQEALDLVKSRKLDAILTDIKMPVKNGLELLKDVRGLGLHTPVVVVTGFGDAAHAKEALRLDATDLVDKPFENSHLVGVIKRALELGVLLNEYDKIIDIAFSNTSLPPEKVEKLKKIRRTVAAMKATTAVYIPEARRKKTS